jgi:hypothetical protein
MEGDKNIEIDIKSIFSELKQNIEINSEGRVKEEILNSSFGNIENIVENIDEFSNIKYVEKLEKTFNILESKSEQSIKE